MTNEPCHKKVMLVYEHEYVKMRKCFSDRVWLTTLELNHRHLNTRCL
jgi:hypothetical protein